MCRWWHQTIAVLVAVFLFSGCTATLGQERPVHHTEPEILDAKAFSSFVEGLPADSFGLSGLTYFDGKLYAASSVGLLEFRDREVHSLYRWGKPLDDVGGPWKDSANRALWIVHYQPFFLSRLDAGGWTRVPVPRPQKGYYSRGDMIDGLTASSGSDRFWLSGAGSAWTWEAAESRWRRNPLPPLPEGSVLTAVTPLAGGPMYIVQGPDDFLDDFSVQNVSGSPNVVYDDPPDWRQRDLGTFSYVSQLVTLGDAACLLTSNDRLLRVTTSEVEEIDCPALCEAIAATADGKLLASFRDKGIFLYDSRWIMRFPCPYSPGSSRHSAYLAEQDGHVAFATSGGIEDVEGEHVYTGYTSVWVSRNGTLESIKTTLPQPRLRVPGPARTPLPAPAVYAVKRDVRHSLRAETQKRYEKVDWEEKIGGSDDGSFYHFQETRDGGFVAVGEMTPSRFWGTAPQKVLLAKFDKRGKVMWKRTFGVRHGHVEGKFVIETEDGGFLIRGRDRASDSPYFIRCDGDGKLIWEKVLPVRDLDTRHSSLEKTRDGDYIFLTDVWAGGNIQKDPERDIQIVRIDESGTVLWKKRVGGPGMESASGIRPTADGGYIVVGTTDSIGNGDWDMLLLKLDAGGDPTWSCAIGGNASDMGKWVEQTADGGFIVCGAVDGPDKYELILIKCGPQGEPVWERVYGKGHSASVVQPTSDGGYIVSGAGYLSKTTGTGEPVWTATFGRSGNRGRGGGFIRETRDGGYVVAGRWYSPGATWPDAWVRKFTLTTKKEP